MSVYEKIQIYIPVREWKENIIGGKLDGIIYSRALGTSRGGRKIH